MESFALHFASGWQPLGYAAAFAGMVVEGEIFLLTFSFLTSQGYFNPFLMFAVVLSGGVVSDFLWFRFGEFLFGGSLIKFPKWIHRLSHPLDRHLNDRPFRTIFVSKFVYGANHATLMRAGALKTRREIFLKSTLAANLTWVVVVGGLGYLFGASFLLLKKYVKFAEIALLTGVVLFLLISHFFFLEYGQEENGESV